MNIKNLDAIASALFPSHYAPQFSTVFPESERAKIETHSDRDRGLYALAGRYSRENAEADYAAELAKLGGALDKNSVSAREKLLSKAEFLEKHEELAKHYRDECFALWKSEGSAISEQLTARVGAVVAAFEAAVDAWEFDVAKAAGVRVPISAAFAGIIADIRKPLHQNLARLHDGGLGCHSVGQFVEDFIGHEFRPLAEFVAAVEKKS